MLDKKIRLKTINDVRDFVNEAAKCEFDVDIFYNRIIVDAKSLLGVMSMDLTKPLTVKYSPEDRFFGKILDKYAVA